MEDLPRLWARVTLTSLVLILFLSWSSGLGIRPFGTTFTRGAPGYNCTLNAVCNETRKCPPGCPCILDGIPCLSGAVCTQVSSGLFCLCPTNTTLNPTTNSCVNAIAPIIMVVNTRRDPGSSTLTGPGLKIAGGPTAGVNATICACRQTANPTADGETRRLNLRLVVTNNVTLSSCIIELLETYLDVSTRKDFRSMNVCTRRDFLFNNKPKRVTKKLFVSINKNRRFILTNGPPEGPRGGYIVQHHSINCTGTTNLTSNTVEFFVAFPSCRGCNFQNNPDNCPIGNGRPARAGNCQGPPDSPPSSRRTRLPCLAFYTPGGAEPQGCTKLYLKGERPDVPTGVAASVKSISLNSPELDREEIIDSAPKDIQPDEVMTGRQDPDDQEEISPGTTQALVHVQKPEDVDDVRDDKDEKDGMGDNEEE